jgi:hypothetical protein
VNLVGEEQWTIKLPKSQPLERVHILTDEAVAYKQRDSIIHASVILLSFL